MTSQRTSLNLSEPTNKKTERAIPGIHRESFGLIRDRFPQDVAVLDLGCGTGAWVDRLRAAGWTDITAGGIDTEDYHGSVPFVTLNLNEGFSDSLIGRRPNGYDLITAIEVIEHLENPSHFLREVHHLLKPNGHLLITSPNVECIPGRLKFLRTGRLRWFDGGDVTHITPIVTEILQRLCVRTGFAIEFQTWLPKSPLWNGTKRWKIPLCMAFANAMRGAVYGDCNCFLLKSL